MEWPVGQTAALPWIRIMHVSSPSAPVVFVHQEKGHLDNDAILSSSLQVATKINSSYNTSLYFFLVWCESVVGCGG